MKTNRQARRLFGAFGKISNTRRMEIASLMGQPIVLVTTLKPSRQQRKAEKEFESLYHLLGQHTQGERD